jgi:DHA3 family tetracycline resistance protein-like MFS transporter
MRRLEAQRTWLVYSGLESLGMAVGWTVAPVYFVREVHMSPLQLVLTGTAMEVAYFLFEVPTGALADLYSRRLSVILAQLVMGASLVVTGLVPSVGAILAAAALMGFGWTFKSGALDAWLADEVGADRLGAEFQRGAQVARALALAGMGVAAGLALIGLRVPVVVGGIVLLALGGFLVVAMPETGFRPASRDDVSAVRSLVRTTREGSRLVRGRPILLLIVGITFFAGMWDEGFDRLWEAHFLLNVGVPPFAGLDSVVWFGVLNAGALLLAMAVARFLANRLQQLDRRGMAASLMALDFALLVGALTFALAGSFALGVAAFWVVKAAMSLTNPVFRTWLNANIEDSRVRATVLSVTGVSHSVGEAGGGPAIGVLGNAFGISAALAAGSLLLSPALFLYGRAVHHHGREPELQEASAAQAV